MNVKAANSTLAFTLFTIKMGSSKKHKEKEKDRDREKRRDKDRKRDRSHKEKRRREEKDNRDEGERSGGKRAKREDFDELYEHAIQESREDEGLYLNNVLYVKKNPIGRSDSKHDVDISISCQWISCPCN